MIRQQYAEVEHRDPTITEIRLFDTYWSDIAVTLPLWPS